MRTTLLFAVIAVTLMSVAACAVASEPSDGGDWPNISGDNSHPYVTESPTPTVSGGAVQATTLWSDTSDTVNHTPSTAVCVGDYAYYVRWSETANHFELVKRNIPTGAVDARTPVPELASGGFYNVPVAYGDGKVFVPFRTGVLQMVAAYNASDLSLAYKSTAANSIGGADPSTTHLTYVESGGGKYLLTGTYNGRYGCLNATDGTRLWQVQSARFYNQVPVIVGDVCLFADTGTSVNPETGSGQGSTVRAVRLATGALLGSVTVDDDCRCMSAMALYDGRLSVPCSLQNSTYTPQAVKVFSYAVAVSGDSATFSDGKVWGYAGGGDSPIGTQSAAVVVDGRLYLGGGGATMGTNTKVSVVDIATDGTMTTAYYIDEKTKSPTVVRACADGTRYLYFTPYEVTASEGLVVAVDRAGQTAPEVYHYPLASSTYYSYQAVSVAAGGELLVKLDGKLLCVAPVSAPVAVSGVSLDSDTLSLGVGASATLVATVSPANATNKNVAWSSDDTGVATVADGLVTGVAEGSARITVTTEDGGFTAHCDVTVSATVSTYRFYLYNSASGETADVGGNYGTGTSTALNGWHEADGTSVIDAFCTVLDGAGVTYTGFGHDTPEVYFTPAAYFGDWVPCAGWQSNGNTFGANFGIWDWTPTNGWYLGNTFGRDAEVTTYLISYEYFWDTSGFTANDIGYTSDRPGAATYGLQYARNPPYPDFRDVDYATLVYETYWDNYNLPPEYHFDYPPGVIVNGEVNPAYFGLSLAAGSPYATVEEAMLAWVGGGAAATYTLPEHSGYTEENAQWGYLQKGFDLPAASSPEHSVFGNHALGTYDGRVLGDITGPAGAPDGVVNNRDLLWMNQILAGLRDPSTVPGLNRYGDVNGDGTFNHLDRARTAQYVAGLRPILPTCPAIPGANPPPITP